MEENIKKHCVSINERKEVFIDGILKLDSFDKNEFLISTSKGYLHITGKDLTLGNMDMEKGTLSINGSIDSVSYLNSSTEQNKEGFLKNYLSNEFI